MDNFLDLLRRIELTDICSNFRFSSNSLGIVMTSLGKGVLPVTHGHMRKRLKLWRLDLIGEINPVGEINPIDECLDSAGK